MRVTQRSRSTAAGAHPARCLHDRIAVAHRLLGAVLAAFTGEVVIALLARAGELGP